MKIVYSITILLVCLPSIFAEVMISEIMYNPYGTETKKEWIEIYNDGASAIDMTGWKIQDGATIRQLSLYQGDWSLDSHSFAILSRNGENFSAEHNFNGDVYIASFSLTNTGKELFLLDGSNNIIDYVNYENIAEEGYTLELIDASKDNSKIENWVQGKFGGNPGKIIKQEPEVPEFGIFGVVLVSLLFFIFKKN